MDMESNDLTKEGQRCFMETNMQPGLTAFAAAGSTTAPWDVYQPHSTLERSRGDGYKKVVPADQESAIHSFLTSGLTANMEDQTASLLMLDKAEDYILKGNGNFGFIFNKTPAVKNSCFEGHGFCAGRLCGRGAAGEVQAFSDPVSQTNFVRKRNKLGRRFRVEEVKSLVQLDHPGVVKLLALLCRGTTMDLLLQDAGHPLRECLKVFLERGISALKYWTVVQDLGAQGFEAIGYMHHKAICHLDLKPENLLVYLNMAGNPVLVLTDFGSSMGVNRMMNLNMELTHEYWAPEMWQHLMPSLCCRKEGNVHSFPSRPEFDTYAFGKCLYFMGTLHHLLKDLECQQREAPGSVVPVKNVQQICHELGCEPDFGLHATLMLLHSDKLAAFGTRGKWLLPGPPPVFLKVISSTLDPDPATRATDEQAAVLLRGNTVNIREDLKVPVPVCDTKASSVECLQAEETPPQPVVEAGQPPHSTCSDLVTSSAQNQFQRLFAHYYKPWDNDVLRMGEEKAGHAVATTTSSQAVAEDIAVRPVSDLSQLLHPPQAPAAVSDHQILRLRGSDISVEDLTVTCDLEDPPGLADRLSVDKDMSMNLNFLMEVSDLFAAGDVLQLEDGYDMEKGGKLGDGDGGMEGDSGAGDGEGGGMVASQPPKGGTMIQVIGNVGALSMPSVKGRCREGSQAVGRKGKGGVAAKVSGLHRKAGKGKGGVYKRSPGKSSSAGKKDLPQKSMKPIHEQLGQGDCGVTFVMGSSRRPKLCARTMHVPPSCAPSDSGAGCRVRDIDKGKGPQHPHSGSSQGSGASCSLQEDRGLIPKKITVPAQVDFDVSDPVAYEVNDVSKVSLTIADMDLQDREELADGFDSGPHYGNQLPGFSDTTHMSVAPGEMEQLSACTDWGPGHVGSVFTAVPSQAAACVGQVLASTSTMAHMSPATPVLGQAANATNCFLPEGLADQMLEAIVDLVQTNGGLPLDQSADSGSAAECLGLQWLEAVNFEHEALQPSPEGSTHQGGPIPVSSEQHNGCDVNSPGQGQGNIPNFSLLDA